MSSRATTEVSGLVRVDRSVLGLVRQRWFCGPSAPVVQRGRGREVLVRSPEREVALAFCFLARIP